MTEDADVKKAYFKAYYLKHKKKLLLKCKQRYQAKKASILKYIKAYRLRNLEKLRAYGREKSREDKSLKRVRKWHKNNRDRIKPHAAKWRANNKPKRVAHRQVATAIEKGMLTKKPCEVCGSLKVHAHHEDYSKPLEIIWLCQKHHAKAHRLYD